MPKLIGIHDEEGAHLVPEDGWCVALVALSDNPAPKNYLALRQNINWLLRVNWGYGSTGTIPAPNSYEENLYLERFSQFIHHSKGLFGIIIGNEPNHEQERPNGLYITPQRYASFFNRVYRLAKQVNSSLRVIPAAIAPYHANPTPWTPYLREVLGSIEATDGICIHAYARSHDPEEIQDDLPMSGELEGTQAGFLTYWDALQEVPSHFHRLPAFITEFNVLPQWENVNSGVVKAAYREINWWNTQPDVQKIFCLCLYRYPDYDRWGIEKNNGVLADFVEASQMPLNEPTINDTPHLGTTTLLPSISKLSEPSSGPSVDLERYLDTRAIARGVTIQKIPPGSLAWRVKELRWLDEQESQGRHHIFFDVLDEQGKRVVGVPLGIAWPTGIQRVETEAKPGEPYAANFPMSPSRNDFSVRVVADIPSETVSGIGMGADTPSGYNPGIHTSTVVVFQRTQTPVSGKELPMAVPRLTHPVLNAEHRIVSQRYGRGVNAAYYSRYGLEGHNGIDFATPMDSQIVAVDDGKAVEVAFDEKGFGSYIKLVHSWGESLYAHLNRQQVLPGQEVKRGQGIGLSGNTGASTGPHLHFGIRVNPYSRQDGMNGYADPTPYLEFSPVNEYTKPQIASIIRQVAEREGLDWELMWSIAWAESSFNPTVNRFGLFQIEDPAWNDTAPDLGVSDRLDPYQNTLVACVYFKWLLKQLDGNIYKSVLAYNFGIGNVLNNVEPPAISKEYVNKVFHGRDLLKAIGV